MARPLPLLWLPGRWRIFSRMKTFRSILVTACWSRVCGTISRPILRVGLVVQVLLLSMFEDQVCSSLELSSSLLQVSGIFPRSKFFGHGVSVHAYSSDILEFPSTECIQVSRRVKHIRQRRPFWPHFRCELKVAALSSALFSRFQGSQATISSTVRNTTKDLYLHKSLDRDDIIRGGRLSSLLRIVRGIGNQNLGIEIPC